MDGLNQGNPFSTTGMIFYIDELIRNSPNQDNGEDAIGFTDDVNHISIGSTLEEAACKTEDFMHQAGGALDWGRTTNCIFSLEKTNCIGMTQQREPDPDRSGRTRPTARPQVVIDGTTIKMTESAKWLGIIIDQELRFQTHTAYAIKKGTDYMQQYR
jgi:hypothetical protein